MALTYVALQHFEFGDAIVSPGDEIDLTGVGSQEISRMLSRGLITGDSTSGGGGVSPITVDDTLVWHEAAQQAIASGAYATIFDLSGEHELLGGSLMSAVPGFRLTLDGIVVADRTSQATGNDELDDFFGVVTVPPARSTTSMKLEAHKISGVSRDFGWRFVTRAL